MSKEKEQLIHICILVRELARILWGAEVPNRTWIPSLWGKAVRILDPIGEQGCPFLSTGTVLCSRMPSHVQCNLPLKGTVQYTKDKRILLERVRCWTECAHVRPYSYEYIHCCTALDVSISACL